MSGGGKRGSRGEGGRDVEGWTHTQTDTHRWTNGQLAGTAVFAGRLVVADGAAGCSGLVLHTRLRCVQVQAESVQHTGLEINTKNQL